MEYQRIGFQKCAHVGYCWTGGWSGNVIFSDEELAIGGWCGLYDWAGGVSGLDNLRKRCNIVGVSQRLFR